MSGRKMAKSAGNFQRITDLADEGIDPLAFRYLCLTSHYRRKLNYSETSIAAAARGARLPAGPTAGARAGSGVGAVVGAGGPRGPDRSGDRPEGIAAGRRGPRRRRVVHRARPSPRARRRRCREAGRALHDRFVAALDDDLDLPVALAVVRETLRADLPADERRWLVLDADAVLGLDLDRVWEATANGDAATTAADEALPEGAAALVEARSAARAARDFARADALRDQLAGMGLELIDRPDGTTEVTLR